MTDRQNTVVATAVAALILVPLFLFPWRVTPGPGAASAELRWSPIYQPPLSYVRSYDDTHSARGSTRIASNRATRAFDLLALQLLVMGVVGGVAYGMVGTPSDGEVPPTDAAAP